MVRVKVTCIATKTFFVFFCAQRYGQDHVAPHQAVRLPALQLRIPLCVIAHITQPGPLLHSSVLSSLKSTRRFRFFSLYRNPYFGRGLYREILLSHFLKLLIWPATYRSCTSILAVNRLLETTHAQVEAGRGAPFLSSMFLTWPSGGLYLTEKHILSRLKVQPRYTKPWPSSSYAQSHSCINKLLVSFRRFRDYMERRHSETILVPRCVFSPVLTSP